MHSTLIAPNTKRPRAEWPIWRLLHPRQYTAAVALSLGAGLTLSLAAMRYWGVPAWVATVATLVVLLPVGVQKWRDDRRHFGATVMILSILLTSQGLHTVEHLIQWTQYHVLYWQMVHSSGLVSPANAEWVHFAWNWSVLIVVVVLMWRGMRGGWAWVLFAVALLHAVEHTYTFARYHMILGELSALNVAVSAQGMPGIVGRDGWLARSAWTQGTFLCSLPGLTTAIRLDVHFWWNALEMAALLLAAHLYLRGLPGFGARQADWRRSGKASAGT